MGRAGVVAGLVGVCALTAGCGGAAGRPPAGHGPHHGAAGLRTVSLQSGGHRRSYLIYVPPGDTGAHPLPLVLVFHGAGDTASGAVGQTDLLSVAEHGPHMILVFPQGYANTWNEGTGGTPAARAHIDDVAFVATILKQVEAAHPVDRHRVVAAGLSNGALLTEYLGCTLSRQLTLIAPVEGQLPATTSAACHPAAPVAVFEVHGTADASIPYAGGGFTGVGGVPGPVVLSAPSSARRWATLDRCPTLRESHASTSVTLSTYSGCAAGVTVTLETIAGGRHAWPSGFGAMLASAVTGLNGTRTATP